jgi:STE24 endopeptidase
MNADAAAAAWLARIPESQRLAAAAATDARLWVWLGVWAAGLAACAIVGRSGMLALISGRLERERPRPWLTGAACAGGLTLIVVGAMTLASAAAAWRTTGVRWIGDALAVAVSAAVAATLLVPPAQWLLRRAPRLGPLLLGGLMATVILAIGWAPYAAGNGDNLPIASATAAKAGVARLVAQTKLPAAGVRASPDPAFDADVTGAFGHATVILGPTMAAGPPAEARAYVGHLMGHYIHGDILAVCLVLSGALLAGLVAIGVWAAPLSRAFGAHGARDAADPAALPGAAFLALATLIFAGLAAAAYLRWANVRADAYSLDQAREPDGLAAVIEREWDHQAVQPNALEEAVFYTHPPLAQRLRQAMAWKAAHRG